MGPNPPPPTNWLQCPVLFFGPYENYPHNMPAPSFSLLLSGPFACRSVGIPVFVNIRGVGPPLCVAGRRLLTLFHARKRGRFAAAHLAAAWFIQKLFRSFPLSEGWYSSHSPPFS